MKSITKLFAGVLALAGILAGCQTMLDGSNLTISPEGVAELDATQQELNVAVTADCNWVASTDADWITLSTKSGSGNGEVTVYVAANTGAAREAIVHFQKSTTRKVSADLTIKQASGLARITCAEFIEKADPNTAYCLVGEVTSSVNTTYCSFDMSDGTGTVVVWKVINKEQWLTVVKQGGTVTVSGKYYKYEKDGTVKHEMIDAYIEDFKEGEAPKDISTESISDVVAAPNESNVTLSNVTVVATAAKGFLVKDVADAYLFVYGEASCNAGDVVTVKGSKSVFYGMPQLKNPEVTVTGSKTITHPAAEDITSSFDSFTSSSVKYISFAGTLTQNDNYYNVNVDGASANVGSILAPSQDISAFIGVPGVTYTGYYVYTSSTKFINIVLTDIQAGNTPYLSVSPANVTVLATATETEISVKSNTTWTAACDNAAFALDKTQGENSATIKVTFAANEESTEKKATVTFTYDGGKTATVAITQKAAGAAGTPVYTFDTSKEGTVGPNNGYNNQGSLEIDGITWTCQGNMKPDTNGQPKPWRVGGKNIENVDRALYTETPMSSAIGKITFTPGNINITLNSAKLVYSTNKDFSDASEKEFTLTANTPVDIVADMPANAYYKFVFNVTNTTKSNKFVEIAKIEFYAAQ